jgi:hypothetical protein
LKFQALEGLKFQDKQTQKQMIQTIVLFKVGDVLLLKFFYLKFVILFIISVRQNHLPNSHGRGIEP